MCMRAIMESGRKDIEVVAINDLGPVETNAHLFRFDSVHGRFNGEVKVAGDTIDVGRGPIKVTCRARSVQAAAQGAGRRHRCSNAPASSPRRRPPRARISTPAPSACWCRLPADNADLTVVYGVNHDKLTKDHM